LDGVPEEKRHRGPSRGRREGHPIMVPGGDGVIGHLEPIVAPVPLRHEDDPDVIGDVGDPGVDQSGINAPVIIGADRAGDARGPRRGPCGPTRDHREGHGTSGTLVSSPTEIPQVGRVQVFQVIHQAEGAWDRRIGPGRGPSGGGRGTGGTRPHEGDDTLGWQVIGEGIRRDRHSGLRSQVAGAIRDPRREGGGGDPGQVELLVDRPTRAIDGHDDKGGPATVGGDAHSRLGNGRGPDPTETRTDEFAVIAEGVIAFGVPLGLTGEPFVVVVGDGPPVMEGVHVGPHQGVVHPPHHRQGMVHGVVVSLEGGHLGLPIFLPVGGEGGIGDGTRAIEVGRAGKQVAPAIGVVQARIGQGGQLAGVEGFRDDDTDTPDPPRLEGRTDVVANEGLELGPGQITGLVIRAPIRLVLGGDRKKGHGVVVAHIDHIIGQPGGVLVIELREQISYGGSGAVAGTRTVDVAVALPCGRGAPAGGPDLGDPSVPGPLQDGRAGVDIHGVVRRDAMTEHGEPDTVGDAEEGVQLGGAPTRRPGAGRPETPDGLVQGASVDGGRTRQDRPEG